MKAPGITRPRRKHPGTLFAGSEVAGGFRAEIHGMLGPHLGYVPVAQFGSGYNAWRLQGPLGRGLLAEAEDGPQPKGVFRTRGVFIGNSWSVWPLRVGMIGTHGWDPWLAREQGEPIPEMSDRRRYRLRDERTAEVAALLDGASWKDWDPNDREDSGGFPFEKLAALLMTHVLRSPPPPVVKRNRGYLLAEFSCPACGWWGRGADLIEREADIGARLLACPNCDAALSAPEDADLAANPEGVSGMVHER